MRKKGYFAVTKMNTGNMKSNFDLENTSTQSIGSGGCCRR